MPEFVDAHALSWVIFLPAVTAVVLLATHALIDAVLHGSGLPEGVWRVVGLGGSVATFVIAIASVLGGFDPEHLGPQHVEYAPWVPAAGVSYFVGVDGISLFLVLLTTGLVPLTLLSARRQVERSARSFVFFVLLLESGLLGVFLALNAALFFLAWQATLVPVFFLIGIWGGSRRVRAATRFLAVWGLGSALLLVALLSVAGGADGVTRFDMLTPPGGVGPGLLEAALPRGQVVWLGRVDQAWLFLALLVGFGLTVPIVPLHGWLLDAESEAPMSALTLLTAVGLKMGAYGMLRFALPLCPDAVAEWGPFLYGIALVGIVYGSLLAAAQTDLRRLVAWWTLAQLGFVLLGTFSLEQNGLTGSVIAMLSHGLTAAALLLLVGAIAERRGSYEISALGGLARPMPVFSAFLGLAILAAMGTPTLSGFVGDLLVVVAGFQVDVTVGLVALVGWVIGAGCLAWAYRRIALGPVENPENRGLIDLDWRERGTLLAVLIPIIWIGLYPNPVLRRIEPSVLELLRQIDERRVVAPVVVDEGSRRDALERVPTPSAPQGEPA